MAEHRDDEVDELVAGLRDDVPEMEPSVFAAGRARLLAHVGAPRVTRTEPTDHVPVVRALSPDRRRGSPRSWVVVATSAAAAVALIAGLAFALLPGESAPAKRPVGAAPTSSAPPSSAVPSSPPPGNARPGDPVPAMPADPLNAAGELADDASDLTLQPGQVRYVRLARSQAPRDGGSGGTDVIETWIPYDREGEWLLRRTAAGEIQGAPEDDFTEKRAAGGRFQDGDSPWGITPDSVAEFPRDPAAIYEKLRTEANAPLPEGTGTTVTQAEKAIDDVFEMLADSSGGLPVDLRAALLQALGYLPGITVTPDGTTSDGRQAVVLSYEIEDGMYRNELLLDPSTARPVEWRNVALKASVGYQPGKTFTSEAYTEAIVSKLGEN